MQHEAIVTIEVACANIEQLVGELGTVPDAEGARHNLRQATAFLKTAAEQLGATGEEPESPVAITEEQVETTDEAEPSIASATTEDDGEQEEAPSYGA